MFRKTAEPLWVGGGLKFEEEKKLQKKKKKKKKKNKSTPKKKLGIGSTVFSFTPTQ